MTTWEIEVTMVGSDANGKPRPIGLNDRPHWTTARQNATRIKNDVAWRVKQQKIPPQDHVTVQLHYAPGDNRRRDPDNLVASAKPAVDGLVTAGVVPDDAPRFVTHLMPCIHPGTESPSWPRRLWLVVQSDEDGQS